MDRAVVCRAVVCLLLGISCSLRATSVRAWENVPEGTWISDLGAVAEPMVPQNEAQIEQAIASKLAEIETLKDEVEQLREQLALGQALEVELKVYEVNLSKMRRLGVDISRFEDGKSVTKEVKTISDFPPNAGAFLEALAKNNIAKLAHRHELKINSGDRCSVKGNKLEFPKSPKSPDQDIYDLSTDLVAKILHNGRYRVEMRVSRTSLDYSHGSEIDGKKVPGFRESMMDVGFECNENQDCLVPSVPELRTMVIRTERGIQEVKEEFQRVVVVRVKKFGDNAPQNAVQPASAVMPFGQGQPYSPE